MKQIGRLCYIFFFVWTVAINAFVPVIDVACSSQSVVVSLNLHPRQAAELEACACECYESQSNSYSPRSRRSLHYDDDPTKTMMTNGSPSSMMNHQRAASVTGRSTGPVAWCLRVIAGSTVNRRRLG
jgi:hypothetical protein